MMYAADVMAQYNTPNHLRSTMTPNHPPVRTLWDMSEEEITALEEQYGCPVIRPTEKPKQLNS